MVYGYHSSQRRSKVPSTAHVDVASPCSSQGVWVQISAQLLPQHHAPPIPAGPAGSCHSQHRARASLGRAVWDPSSDPARDPLTSPSTASARTHSLCSRDLNVQLINISLSVHSWPLDNCLQCPAAQTASLLPARNICPCPLTMPQR